MGVVKVRVVSDKTLMCLCAVVIPTCPCNSQPSYWEGCGKAAVHSMDPSLEEPVAISNDNDLLHNQTLSKVPSSHLEDS